MSSMIHNLFALSALLALFVSTPALQAADTKMEVTLVWGTNYEKSPDPKHKELEKDLAERLGKIFQWQHYFLVNKLAADVKKDGSYCKFKLSEDAVVEITEQDDSKFQIKLIGKDKLVTTRTEVIKKGDITALAGDVHNTGCAWFILIRQK
jgi:hypothetical protein